MPAIISFPFEDFSQTGVKKKGNRNSQGALNDNVLEASTARERFLFFFLFLKSYTWIYATWKRRGAWLTPSTSPPHSGICFQLMTQKKKEKKL